MNEKNKTLDTDESMGDPRDELDKKDRRESAKEDLEKFTTKIKAKDGRTPAFVIPFRNDNDNLKLQNAVKMMANRYGEELFGQDLSHLRFDYMATISFMLTNKVLEFGGLKKLLDEKKDAQEQTKRAVDAGEYWKELADDYGKLIAKLSGDKAMWARHATKEEKIEKLAEKTNYSVEELEEKSDDFLEGLLSAHGYIEVENDKDMSKDENEHIEELKEERSSQFDGKPMNDKDYKKAVEAVAEKEGEDWKSLSDVEKADFRSSHQKKIQDKYNNLE